jgi:hypothetical protein
MFMKKILSVIILSLFSNQVFAGFTIEPFYDSMFSTSTKEKNAPTGSDESVFDNAGTVYGAKLYVNFKAKKGNMYAGLYGYLSETDWTLLEPASLVDSQNDSNQGVKDKWHGKHAGVIIGTYHQAFDAWVAALATEMKDRSAEGSFDKNDELRGTTIEVGLGMRLLSWLKLNATWRNHKLSNYRDSSERRSYTLPEEDTKLMGDYDVKEYYLGVSMPLTIGKRK